METSPDASALARIILVLALGTAVIQCVTRDGVDDAVPGANAPGASVDPARADLDDLIARYGFRPVLPPRSDVVPGSILESAEPGAGFVGAIPVTARAADAEFVRTWQARRALDAGVLLELLPDQELARAELGKQGVRFYELRFDDCEILSTDLLSLERTAREMPADVHRHLRRGSPVVLESLLVRGLTVSFEEADRTVAAVDVPIVEEVAGGGFSVEPVASGTYVLTATRPVVLGIKTRTVLADAGGNLLDLTERLARKDEDAEPNDDRSEASMLGVDATVNGAVGFGADGEDWYLIVPERDGYATIRLTNATPERTKGARLSAAYLIAPGKEHRLTNTMGPGRKQEKRIPLSGGEIHYLRVRAVAGEASRYRVDVGFEG